MEMAVCHSLGVLIALLNVTDTAQEDLVHGHTPNDTPAPFFPRMIMSSKALFFSYHIPRDRSGASVADRKRSDLCATSGANIYGGMRIRYVLGM